MPVDRKIYKVPFFKGEQPEWICPVCGKGILGGIKGSFNINQDKKSGRYEVEGEIYYVYSCLFICSNSNCRATVSNTGVGGQDMFLDYANLGEDGEPGVDFKDIFTPKYFHPHLKIFDVHKDVPGDVVKELNKSFEVFFCDPSAASGHIRVALENLLDSLKVKRFRINNKKRRKLSLHERIENVPEIYKNLKSDLLAIKWLGNAGSHPGEVTKDDVMDAYDILEVVFSELFDKKEYRKAVKQINKKKGPRKSKA